MIREIGPYDGGNTYSEVQAPNPLNVLLARMVMFILVRDLRTQKADDRSSDESEMRASIK